MRRLAALTAVEILIAIVIIGVLLGLLLPATQASRQRARQAESAAGSAMPAGGESEGGSMPPSTAPSTEGKFSRFADVDAYHTALQVEGRPEPTADAARKIIYEAQIALVVKDVAETEAAVVKLLEEYEGYVAESNVAGRKGQQLTGTWDVRIPVDKFQEFLAAVAKLGVTENRQQTAQDVSEEFVDLTARVANQKELERRIVALLDSASDDIEDVIQVEQQLARVRGEIEQMEGRLRYLTNRVELTTVSITAREERDYVPPEAPMFTSQVKQAWSGSLEAMRSAGKRLSVAAVAAVPWIVVLGVVVGLPAWRLGRRRSRRRALGLDSPA